MILVLLESPFAGSVEDNVRYARACMHDCFERGEAPYASHLLYTQPGVLDDDDAQERAKGIEAGLLWGAQADKTVVYVDRGISGGMIQGIERAKADGRSIVLRSLDGTEIPWITIILLLGPRADNDSRTDEINRLNLVVKKAFVQENL